MRSVGDASSRRPSQFATPERVLRLGHGFVSDVLSGDCCGKFHIAAEKADLPEQLEIARLPRAVDREAQVHDQEAAARAVRSILGAQHAARSARASTRRFGGGCSASRGDGANSSSGDEREDDGGIVRMAPTGGPFAA